MCLNRLKIFKQITIIYSKTFMILYVVTILSAYDFHLVFLG